MSAGSARRPLSEAVTDLRTAMDVSGLKVIVTGGAGGIGWGIARAFAERGATVAVLDVDVVGGRAAAERLQRSAAVPERSAGQPAGRPEPPAAGEPIAPAPAGEASGGGHFFVECDVADCRMVRTAVDAVMAAFGRIDVLVNNAGIAAIKPFLDMDDDLPEWHRVIDVDLHGTAYVTHAVANEMRKEGHGGLIINISSVGGATCSASKELPNTGYVASKAAINHLTKSWAVEFAEHDIRVNCVMPGPTHSKLDEQLTPEYEQRIADGILDRRYGEPLEIGALCVFLASREGAHLNGVVIPHDGGYLCIN